MYRLCRVITTSTWKPEKNWRRIRWNALTGSRTRSHIWRWNCKPSFKLPKLYLFIFFKVVNGNLDNTMTKMYIFFKLFILLSFLRITSHGLVMARPSWPGKRRAKRKRCRKWLPQGWLNVSWMTRWAPGFFFFCVYVLAHSPFLWSELGICQVINAMVSCLPDAVVFLSCLWKDPSSSHHGAKRQLQIFG